MNALGQNVQTLGLFPIRNSAFSVHYVCAYSASLILSAFMLVNYLDL